MPMDPESRRAHERADMEALRLKQQYGDRAHDQLVRQMERAELQELPDLLLISDRLVSC